MHGALGNRDIGARGRRAAEVRLDVAIGARSHRTSQTLGRAQGLL